MDWQVTPGAALQLKVLLASSPLMELHPPSFAADGARGIMAPSGSTTVGVPLIPRDSAKAMLRWIGLSQVATGGASPFCIRFSHALPRSGAHQTPIDLAMAWGCSCSIGKMKV